MSSLARNQQRSSRSRTASSPSSFTSSCSEFRAHLSKDTPASQSIYIVVLADENKRHRIVSLVLAGCSYRLHPWSWRMLRCSPLVFKLKQNKNTTNTRESGLFFPGVPTCIHTCKLTNTGKLAPASHIIAVCWVVRTKKPDAHVHAPYSSLPTEGERHVLLCVVGHSPFGTQNLKIVQKRLAIIVDRGPRSKTV